MRLVSLFSILTIIIVSCKAQSDNSISERNARIISAIEERNKKYAEETGLPPVTDITIEAIDSLTASEYLELATKNERKLLDFQKLTVESYRRSVKLDSILLKVTHNEPEEYIKASDSYKKSVTNLDNAVSELNTMQGKIDSCDAIIRSTPNDFLGYKVVVAYKYTDSNEVKNGKIPFLVSKEFKVSRF